MKAGGCGNLNDGELERVPFSIIAFRKCLKKVSYEKLVKWMYEPTDPSSLGVARFLFGLLMLVDLPEERGGSDIDIRWGEPRDCHFPLFPSLRPLPYAYMALLYGIMWLGASGIMLGFKFRLSTLLFGVPYWYLILLDKSYWNNHSYLYGIVTILFMGSSANHYFSLDGVVDKTKRNTHVPYWNYFILKFQFFLMYFVAGLKKTDKEWLEGYSMSNLGKHWVFIPFMTIITTEQIDYLVVHWFGFMLDLTIGFWMMIESTRPIAMLFCASFHLMNSRLFSIGMFPYVCLATMPLFCAENWPKTVTSLFMNVTMNSKPHVSCVYAPEEAKKCVDLKLSTNIDWKHKSVVAVLLAHCALQGFLPYSHFITKGYNNWTNGLYGYSWDMMVHSWDTNLVVIKVVDNNSSREYFLDPEAWTQNDRWNKHADMCLQYAQCLKNNLLIDLEETKLSPDGNDDQLEKQKITSENISIYVDVWCSLNGRFQQRMFDPNYDLLKAKWSPFETVGWLKPVLSEYSELRAKMNLIREEVYSWSNYSDVLFVSDFPGLFLDNFISDDLRNVTLTVIDGEVVYEYDDQISSQSYGIKLKKNESVGVEVGMFHKIHTVSSAPSCYMYVYINRTKEYLGKDPGQEVANNRNPLYSPFPLVEDTEVRIDSFLRMISHISNSFLHVLYDTPLVRRTRFRLTQ